MSQIVCGIDVGGTNIKLGLVNTQGRLIDKTSFSTRIYNQHRNKLIQALNQSIISLLAKNDFKKKDVLGIGIGLPGLVNPAKGTVVFLPNIPGWKNVPLRALIERKLGIKTFIDNDVKLITLAEWKYGAGAGVKNLVCLTLGTGIGSGLILNNELYRGEGNSAGELGHIPLNESGPKCNCGGWGCFERYLGNQVLFNEAERLFQKKGMKTMDVFRLAKQGNKKALKYWHDVSVRLGNGLVTVVNLLNPRLIILGGGVSNNFEFMHKTVSEVIKKRAMRVPSGMVKVVRAKLGDDAGIIGANVLVRGKIIHRL